eukprot:CAMPEP_0176144816 /NCGR_PEP_ID=MMETSP0120_2-20121206/73747_1 /TAXON_ID=160619 /ORGANISM="Kryptoperidinium foliaceum, Strain CCMP 1326" /LENGTH=78 /DNA_ID=CAMNT_0017481227 /DNA_START=447 /DNA_END=679 /DNA_ORIENTATION=-
MSPIAPDLEQAPAHLNGHFRQRTVVLDVIASAAGPPSPTIFIFFTMVANISLPVTVASASCFRFAFVAIAPEPGNTTT